MYSHSVPLFFLQLFWFKRFWCASCDACRESRKIHVFKSNLSFRLFQTWCTSLTSLIVTLKTKANIVQNIVWKDMVHFRIMHWPSIFLVLNCKKFRLKYIFLINYKLKCLRNSFLIACQHPSWPININFQQSNHTFQVSSSKKEANTWNKKLPKIAAWGIFGQKRKKQKKE